MIKLGLIILADALKHAGLDFDVEKAKEYLNSVPSSMSIISDEEYEEWKSNDCKTKNEKIFDDIVSKLGPGSAVIYYHGKNYVLSTPNSKLLLQDSKDAKLISAKKWHRIEKRVLKKLGGIDD